MDGVLRAGCDDDRSLRDRQGSVMHHQGVVGEIGSRRGGNNGILSRVRGNARRVGERFSKDVAILRTGDAALEYRIRQAVKPRIAIGRDVRVDCETVSGTVLVADV